MSAMASQTTSLTIVYSTVYSRRRSKKTSKLCVTGLYDRWPVKFSHEGPVTQKMFPFDDVIMVTRSWWLKSKRVILIHIYIYDCAKICGLCMLGDALLYAYQKITAMWAEWSLSIYLCTKERALNCKKTSWWHLLCFKFIYQRTCLNKDMAFETVQ